MICDDLHPLLPVLLDRLRELVQSIFQLIQQCWGILLAFDEKEPADTLDDVGLGVSVLSVLQDVLKMLLGFLELLLFEEF